MRVQRTAGNPPLVFRRCRRALLGLAVLVLVCSSWVGEAHAAIVYSDLVLMSGSQEVPAVASPGFGGGTAVLDTDANTLRFEIAVGGLSAAETAAHIHGPADPGVNAGVVFALPLGNPKIGTWNYPETLEADILAGRMYMNVHTLSHPAGEIRGQVTSTAALLDGAQETPPSASTGNGAGVFHLDTQANQLKYYIVIAGLGGIETAAHIHGFALHGTAAGVIHPLPLGSPKVGVFNYSEPQEEGLLSGQTYVNVHTTTHPGGEIRGQIVGTVAPMHGAQEVPPTGSPGAGMGMVSFDRNVDALSYYIWVAGLRGVETAAHIHGFAPRGVNAGVQHALPAGSRKLGLWNFGAANQGSVFLGNTYFNVHSTTSPGGEIRGQIEYFYHRQAVDAPERDAAGPTSFGRSVPNPFRNTTSIHFSLGAPGAVRVAIYDMRGRLVRTLAAEGFKSGAHAISWDGRDESGRAASSGVYRYVVQTPQGRKTGPLTLLR